MKAKIQTTKRARKKIIKFLQDKGLKVESDDLDITVSGEPDKAMFALVELNEALNAVELSPIREYRIVEVTE